MYKYEYSYIDQLIQKRNELLISSTYKKVILKLYVSKICTNYKNTLKSQFPMNEDYLNGKIIAINIVIFINGAIHKFRSIQ